MKKLLILSTLFLLVFSNGYRTYAEGRDTVQLKVNYIINFKYFADDANFVTDEMILEVGKHQTSFYSIWRRMRNERMDSLRRTGITNGIELSGRAGNIPRSNFNYEIFDNVPNEGMRTVYCRHLIPFYYEEKIEPQTWEIIDRDSVILEYHCKMAKCKFRGHNWTVWFTEEIPLAVGPWKLSGLPGLILKADDDNKMCSFDAIEIKNGKGEELYRMTGKVMKGTRKQDTELVVLKATDLDAYMKRMGLPGAGNYVDKDGRLKKIDVHYEPMLMEDE